MPPSGGFEAIKYKRNLPVRGPSGVMILTAVTAVCAYGFYRVGAGNLEKRYVFLLPPFSFFIPIFPYISIHCIATFTRSSFVYEEDLKVQPSVFEYPLDSHFPYLSSTFPRLCRLPPHGGDGVLTPIQPHHHLPHSLYHRPVRAYAPHTEISVSSQL